MRLFSWFILRKLIQEPLRTLTTALGIALGVAVIVAIQLTNAASLAGFKTALDTVSGRTSLEIVGTGIGVNERHLLELEWLAAYGRVAPVIEGDIVWTPGAGRSPERLHVLGIDILRDRPFRDYRLRDARGRSTDPRPQDFLELLADARSIVLTAKFATPRHLAIGDTLPVRVGDRLSPLTIRGLLEDEGPARVLDGQLVLMDIAGAQQLFNRFGWIDRIEVQLAGDRALETVQRDIASRLPPGLAVQRPARRSEQVEQMLAAFHLNLTALSYVALLVGLFLVYNTVSIAVLSRRTEIGTLRALGVSHGRVRALFLGEAAVLAAVGASAGLLVGRVLADGAVAMTATAVSAIYIAVAAATPVLEPRHFLLAFATAVPLSLLAAIVPAQEASRVPPTAAITGSDRAEIHLRISSGRLALAGLLLALGLYFALRGPIRGLPLFGYVSAVLIVFGVSVLVPVILVAVVRLITPSVRSALRVEDWLAMTNLAAAVPRLSISIAALAVSLSMMVAIAIMIGSFRQTVVYWIGQTLQADLFISTGSRQQSGAADALSADLIQLVASSPLVAAIDRFRTTEVPYGPAGIRVGGADFQVLLEHGSLLFKEAADAREQVLQAIGQDAVVASEAFVLKHHHRVGDTIALPTAYGPAPFRIAAVYTDYSRDRGVVMMDRQVFQRHYDDGRTAGLTVYLKDGVDPETARSELMSAIGDRHQVFINTNRALRTEVLRIFDSTFAITYALEIIAIIVAMLGVSGTLLTLILDREHELTILRVIGTGRRQIRRMVVGEALVVGAVSQGIGLLVGFVLSLLLVFVINVQSFGWTIQFHLPLAFLAQSSVLMVLATGLAGLYPAYRAVRLTMARPATSPE
jgi:putative ABC transport system permease protein